MKKMKPKQALDSYHDENCLPITEMTREQLMNALAIAMDVLDDIEDRLSEAALKLENWRDNRE